MIKKIIFILLLMLTLNSVKAKSITINDQKIELTGDISGDGYYFNNAINLLTLNNYHGGAISLKGTININIVGNNSITSEDNSISANTVNLYGNGTLELYSKKQGIFAPFINIDDITIIGETKGDALYFSNNLRITNAYIEFNTEKNLMEGGEKITVTNSIIKSNNLHGLTYKENAVVMIENSYVRLNSIDKCINSNGKLQFIDSKVFLKSKNDVVTAQENIIIDDNSKYQISIDGINYNEVANYLNCSSLQIASANYISKKGDTEEENILQEPIEDTETIPDNNDNNNDNVNGDNNADEFNQEDIKQENKDEVNNDCQIENNQNNTSTDNKENSENLNNKTEKEDSNNTVDTTQKEDVNNTVDTTQKEDVIDNDITNKDTKDEFYDDSENNDIQEIINPQTGDNIHFWVITLTISTIITLVLIGVRKKYGKMENLSLK